MLPEERLEFRNQLLEVLLRVDGLVVKLLAEAVSITKLVDPHSNHINPQYCINAYQTYGCNFDVLMLQFVVARSRRTKCE